jgi:hypothetical protein
VVAPGGAWSPGTRLQQLAQPVDCLLPSIDHDYRPKLPPWLLRGLVLNNRFFYNTCGDPAVLLLGPSVIPSSLLGPLPKLEV